MNPTRFAETPYFDMSATYYRGDLATVNAAEYRSKRDNNIGNDPAASPKYWGRAEDDETEDGEAPEDRTGKHPCLPARIGFCVLWLALLTAVGFIVGAGAYAVTAILRAVAV